MNTLLSGKNAIVRSVLAASAGAPGIAEAHHFMDGGLPATFGQGILSGLAHPLIGLDHAVFIIVAGLLFALVPKGLIGLLALIAGSVVGALLHLHGMIIPKAEVAIAGSVVIAAALLLIRPRIRMAWAAPVALAAGAVHGYTYAETIFGAETTPLVAYVLGFAAIQFAVGAAALVLHGYALRHHPGRASFGRAAVSAVALAIGAVLLVY